MKTMMLATAALALFATAAYAGDRWEGVGDGSAGTMSYNPNGDNTAGHGTTQSWDSMKNNKDRTARGYYGNDDPYGGRSGWSYYNNSDDRFNY